MSPTTDSAKHSLRARVKAIRRAIDCHMTLRGRSFVWQKSVRRRRRQQTCAPVCLCWRPSDVKVNKCNCKQAVGIIFRLKDEDFSDNFVYRSSCQLARVEKYKNLKELGSQHWNGIRRAQGSTNEKYLHF